MKIIITSGQDNIILNLPYDEILKFLEVLKEDKPNYSKTVTIISDKVSEEDCGFIRHLKDLYDTQVKAKIYLP